MRQYFRDREQRRLAEAIRTAEGLRQALRQRRERLASPQGSGPYPGELDTGALLGVVLELPARTLAELTRPAQLPVRGGGSFQGTLAIPLARLGKDQRQQVADFIDAQAQKAQPGTSSARLWARLRPQWERASLRCSLSNRAGSQALWAELRFPGSQWTPDFWVGSVYQAPPRESEEAPDATTPAPSTEEERVLDLSLEDAPYTGACLEVARALGVAIVADAFTLRERMKLKRPRVRAQEALAQLEQTFRVRRTWVGRTLLVRSRRWEDRLEDEPPARHLDALVERVREAGNRRLFGFEDWLAHVRVLTRAQVDGLSRWEEKGQTLLDLAGPLGQSWDLLRWAATFSRPQLVALVGAGITPSRLSGPQLQALSGLLRREGLDQELAGCRALRFRVGNEVGMLGYPFLQLLGEGENVIGWLN